MASSMGIPARDLMVAIGDPFRPGDKIRSFLWLVAERAGLTPRNVRAAWEGGPVSERTLKRLREAAASHATHGQALDLAHQLETMAISLREVAAARDGAAGDILDDAAGALRRAAGALRTVARP